MRYLPLLLLLLPAAATADDRIGAFSPVDVAADETLDGDVIVLGADARVHGVVHGDVIVIGGTLELGPDARVDGSTVHLGGDLRRAEGAMVPAPAVSVTPPRAPRARPTAGGMALGGLGAALVGVCGLLLLSAVPERSRNVRRTVEAAPGTALALGLLVSAALGLLSLLLVLSLVGVLALPLVLVAGGGGAVAGLAGLLEALGDRVPQPSSGRSRARALGIGCLAFAATSVVAGLGGLVGAAGVTLLTVATAVGLGAVVLSGLGRAPYAG